MRRLAKRRIKYFLILCVTFVVGTMGLYYYVGRCTNPYIFDDVSSITYNKVGVLLGTSKYLSSGYVNEYYKYRIDAAVLLYNKGKISFLLVSGDSSSRFYNEPMTIKKDLIACGIPAHKIFLDNYGLRTYDSILRCSSVYGLTNFTIISQQFHNQRALYIAQKKHLNAIAFNAQDKNFFEGFKIFLRESIARIKMMSDIIENKDSKFEGEKIIIL